MLYFVDPRLNKLSLSRHYHAQVTSKLENPFAKSSSGLSGNCGTSGGSPAGNPPSGIDDITEAQADLGDAATARLTLTQALQAADAGAFSEAFLRIAQVQAKAGDIDGALRTVKALKSAPETWLQQITPSQSPSVVRHGGCHWPPGRLYSVHALAVVQVPRVRSGPVSLTAATTYCTPSVAAS
jgi:hypothetical protein